MALAASCRSTLRAARAWSSFEARGRSLSSLSIAALPLDGFGCPVDESRDLRRATSDDVFPEDDREGNSPMSLDELLAPPVNVAQRDAQPKQQKCKWCELNYESLDHLMGRGNLWLVDVREKNEVQKAGMIPQSFNIPLSSLKRALLQDSDDFLLQYGFPKPQKQDECLVFYSMNHVKGGTALEIAHRLGFRKARQFPGGYQEWISRQLEKLPVEEDVEFV